MSGRRDLAAMLRQDARIWRHDLLVNRVLGSSLMPRTVRYAIFQALRLPVRGILWPGTTILGPLRNLAMGVDSTMGRRSLLDLSAPITIGRGTAIGMKAMIITSNHPIDEQGRWAVPATPLPITIGDHVWIGARVTICPGAVIESNVVIAAGAVVIGRLEQGGIYGGVPARRLGAKVITGSAG